ncbi:hypothetical protein VTK73DRAFT_6115 [Phialemonium thermophilum]|uniref:Flavin reductase like domain-containing protein n=1 Tax=Phialemonium thermophilum TaxID=223376 RepID=A0ABR3V0P5_9PEZI
MKGRRLLTCSARHGLSQHGLLPQPRAEPCRETGRRTISHVAARCLQTSSAARLAWKVAPAAQPSVHPHSSSSETQPMSEQLRALMRLLTHSVVVCTSTAPPSEEGPNNGGGSGNAPAPRAMTMSSFTSLALRPVPVVTFNVATPSRTLDAVRASRRFNVHVLAGDTSGARVADWFTRGNDGRGGGVFEHLQRACGTEVVPAVGGGDVAVVEPPVLRGEGILYVLRCRLLDQPLGGLIPVQDHVVVLGEVMDILEGREGGSSGARDDSFGLIYADRRYRQLGNTLTKVDSDEDTR